MRTLLLSTVVLAFATPVFAQSQDETAVLKVEEQLRLAEVTHDTAKLADILHSNYYGMNQNGYARNKPELLELWKTFRVQSIEKDNVRAQVTGNVAVVHGGMTEVNGTGIDRMLFTRVYTRENNGWQLISSMQARRPAMDQVASADQIPVSALHELEHRPSSLTGSGITAEEVKVGGSCVVVVSRPGVGDLAVTTCH